MKCPRCQYDNPAGQKFCGEWNKDKCPKTHPQTGTELAFWHPNLKTIHIWAWYPSPAGGVFKKKNPYLDAFDPKAAQAAK